ncbi:MAG: hypothetical protein ACKO1M_12720, partial [Planctomycetota bacterium]
MSFTGSEARLSGATAQSIDEAPLPLRRVGRGGPRGRIRLGGVAAEAETRRALDPAELAARTACWLRQRQAGDGHWRGPLEGDTILESEYLLLLAWAGRLQGAVVEAAARRILGEQLPTGGWAIYPGGPVDVSASV